MNKTPYIKGQYDDSYIKVYKERLKSIRYIIVANAQGTNIHAPYQQLFTFHLVERNKLANYNNVIYTTSDIISHIERDQVWPPANCNLWTSVLNLNNVGRFDR